MPNPDRSQVHINQPLTTMSLAYVQTAEGFVADKVFPVIPVKKQSDAYFTYNRADFNRNQMKKRAPGTESAGGGYTHGQSTYFADVWAFHKDIDDQTRANYDEPLNADRDATIFVTNKALINREVEWAATYFGASKWGTDVAGHASAVATNQIIHWSAATTSTPVKDIALYSSAMKKATGYRPNTLVLGNEAWDALKNHPEILDRIKYGGSNGAPAQISRQAVASLFEVSSLLVMEGILTDDTAASSQEPAAFPQDGTPDVQKFIGSPKMGALLYVPPAPGIMTPAAGYTFAWTGYAGANAWGGAVSDFRIPTLKSDRIEIESAYAQKVVGKDLGIFFTGLVA